MAAAARAAASAIILTTEKDAINLGAYLQEIQPIYVVPVKMELLDAEQCMQSMLARIEQRRRQPT